MRHHLTRIWRYGKRIADAYQRHNGPMMAAALAFYGVLSLVPLLTLGLTLLATLLGGSESAMRQVERTLLSSFPASGKMLYETLQSLQRDSRLLGGVSLLALLFTASALFANLETAFHTIWEVRPRRSWIRRRARTLLVTLLTLLLSALSLSVTSLMTYTLAQPELLKRIPMWQPVAGSLVSVLLSILMFTLLYQLVPGAKVSFLNALRGGAAAGIVWELAKLLFTLYLSNFGRYDQVYGSLGGIVILLVWCYYSAKILLMGAEMAADSRCEVATEQS